MDRRTERYARMGLCLVAGLSVPLLMNAQVDRSRAPEPGPAPAVNIGKHVTIDLPNGMHVIVVENHKLPMVGVQVRFDSAPMAQGDKAGYVDLMGELLGAGTKAHDKAQIDEAVDRIGAMLVPSSDGVYASSLKKHLPTLMELVSEVVMTPTFPEAELNKARQRHISEVQQRVEDPSAISDAVGRSVTFGRTHPYGEVVTEKTLRNVTRDHLAIFHQLTFRPEKGYLVLVGDITEKEAKALAKQHFAKWKPAAIYPVVNDDGSETINGLGDVHTITKASGPQGLRRVMLVDRPGAAQSIIRVGFPLNLQPKDVRALSAQVMNTILGGGVFNARLMQNLREDKGWTYGTGSSMESDRYNGQFHTSASVRTAVTDSAIAETIKEIERMRTTPVTAEELDLAKRYMAGSFARSLEDPRTVARFALNTHLNQLPEDHYATYLKRLDAVTAQDVQAAAEAFLHPDNAVILVVGDKSALMSKLAPLSWTTNPAVVELDHNGEFWVEEMERVKDMTAEKVIEKYLVALGGREAMSKLKGVRMEIATEFNGTPITIVQWYGSDDHFRSQAKAAGVTVQEEVCDGERAVRKGAGVGEEELFDIDLDDLRFNGQAIPELAYPRTTERIALGGRTALDGKKALKVVVQVRGGGSAGDYFDEATGLKLRRVEQKFMQGQSMKITTDYSDYKSAGGVLFPRNIRQSGGPMGDVVLTVTAIETGLDLKPPTFTTGLGERKVEEIRMPIDEPGQEQPTPEGEEK